MPTLDADYYALLRVAPGADAATIRAAWAVEQRLWGVRQNAPDLATRHAAERHVQLLGEVKDVLLDPQRRAQYDLARALASSLIKPLPLGEAARSAGEGCVSARDHPSPPPSPRGRGGWIARHGDLLKPLVIGLAGALITGSQVFHWDVGSIAAAVSWLRALTDVLHS